MSSAVQFSRSAVLWFAVFVVLPAVDLLNGFLISQNILVPGSAASPSQIGRILLVFILLNYSLRHRGTTPYIMALLSLCLMTEIVVGILVQSVAGFAYGLVNVGKVMCFVLAASISVSSSHESLALLKFFRWGVGLMALSIVFAFVTGTGEPTYGSGGFGTKGYFASGNAIGIFLGTSLLILVHQWKTEQSQVPKSLLLLLFVSLFLIASKTALILAIICAFFIFVGRGRSSGKLSIAGLVLLYFAWIIDWQAIWQIIEVVAEIIIRRYNNSDGDMLLFLSSGRLGFVMDAVSQSEDRFNVFRFVMGGGAFASFQDFSSVKAADILETDIVDVFFMYGIPGLILYLMSWGMIFYRNRHMNILTLACILLMAHSVLAGHVFFNGLLIQLIIVVNVMSGFNRVALGSGVPAEPYASIDKAERL